MKKSFLSICMALCSLIAFAQTAINADGTIKYRGNVAIIVTSHTFTFDNGVFKKKVDDELITELKSSFNAMAMQRFGLAGLAIVNRDNDAYSDVIKLLEEQKLEDYINGFSVQAKGQGADALFLSDITVFNQNNVSQIFISNRLINITNNVGIHYSLKTKPFAMDNAIAMSSEIKEMISQYRQKLLSQIRYAYPEQYAITKNDGKKLYLSAYQPNGAILKEDVFHAFKYGKETVNIGNRKQEIQVLQKVATANNPIPEGGFCVVKSDKALQPSNDIVLFRNDDNPELSVDPMLFTFFPLPYEPNTYDGFIKNRINNAVYDALSHHPGVRLIEQEHLSDLKKERDLQKTEEFIDGHVVEQMKGAGAQYLIHLENYKQNGSQVTFDFNLISVAENRILRTVNVVTSVDNIEKELYKQVCERIAYPCNITMTSKKAGTILTGWSLPENTKIIIQATKQVKNPITGELSYTKTQICKCIVTEYMGCKCNVIVDEILSKEDFNIISDYSAAGLTNLMIDASNIESNTSTVSDVDKKIKKIEILNSIGNALLKGFKNN